MQQAKAARASYCWHYRNGVHVNDTIDSAVAVSRHPTARPTDRADSQTDRLDKRQPGPDDLRWAEEMFEEWQRRFAAAASTKS